VAIAYERTGQGPAIVLLHPLGADRRVWDPIVERLDGRRELIAVDMPGFGESAPLAGTPTPRALAEAVGDLLTTIGLERPHVAGISLGGWVGLELALRGDVRSTTAIAPAGLWRTPLKPKTTIGHALAGVIAPLIRPVAATGAGRRLLLSGVVAHPDRVSPADTAHLVRAWARAPGFVEVSRAMRAGQFVGLERISSPITLVWPEHDTLVKRPRSLPDNVRNLELADAGHLPVWDAPDALTAIVLDATTQADADPGWATAPAPSSPEAGIPTSRQSAAPNSSA
jgi:pimeloyl-ACP methyl ester carboxylesterase